MVTVERPGTGLRVGHGIDFRLDTGARVGSGVQISPAQEGPATTDSSPSFAGDVFESGRS